MNVAVGDAGIVVAFCGSLISLVLLVGSRLLRDQRMAHVAMRVAWTIAVGAVVSFVALERGLITRDFTMRYVFENGSHRTPQLYNFAAAWASLEGSILLWGLVLSGYLAVTLFKFRDRVADPLVIWAVAVMCGVCAFFFGLMLGPADPFESVSLPPEFVDGPGPNPLLQNHVLMVAHPPMLYLGYVGFTVPFSLAIAALITGRLGEGWLVEARRFTLFAWGFLTLGILLGAWWSYDVLGWGGYWGWDPVENVSLLPWLTGTAYLHSVMAQERRAMLRVWNLSLLCATFALTILGTFITRSGVLESVHAFSESSLGPAFLAFFAVIAVATVVLIGWRGDLLRSPGLIDSPASREGAFLANNALFAVFAFVVLLGTVFPLIAETLWDERISVGSPYFSRMTMPLGMLILFLMAVAPVLPWRKANPELLIRRLHWPAWLGAVSMMFSLALGARGLVPILAFGLAGFAAGAAIRQVVLATRRSGLKGLVGRTNGGMIVHLGVVVVAVALAASNSYLRQAEFALEPGDTVQFAGSTVTFEKVVTERRIEKEVISAEVRVDDELTTPAMNLFANGGSIGTPSTAGGALRDIQIALVKLPQDTGGLVVVRLTYQPLVAWLWLGGLIMVLGTAMAAFPARWHRRPTDPVSSSQGTPEVVSGRSC